MWRQAEGGQSDISACTVPWRAAPASIKSQLTSITRFPPRQTAALHSSSPLTFSLLRFLLAGVFFLGDFLKLDLKLPLLGSFTIHEGGTMIPL